MILVTALYPNAPKSRFDSTYYVERHTPFAHTLLGPHGLLSIRTTVGIEALDGASPAFWAISEMSFASREAFDAAIAEAGAELFADVLNYTDVTPILQTSSIVEKGR